MDDVAGYNQARWEDLARNRVMYSRPWLDLDAETARRRVDPRGMLDTVEGKDVLCLCGGGGQQAPAFALLGARVTTHDFCTTQLERDRETAAHYGVEVHTHQGDMRDLSAFGDNRFDIVYHAHSIAFVPDPERAFSEAARVLRPGGMYYTHFCNPCYQGLSETVTETGGYTLTVPYGCQELPLEDPEWEISGEEDVKIRVQGPREFRHSLSGIVNGLIGLGFELRGLWEDMLNADPKAAPGSWEHYCAIAPPYLELWARLGRH